MNGHPQREIAFLTMDCTDNFVVYDHLAEPALNELGWRVRNISWRDRMVDWDDLAAVVIRSPWDYHFFIDEFLQVLETIDRSRARLLNSLKIVRWNIDKLYLHELEQAGHRIVPTIWATSPTHESLCVARRKFECDELIIKPTVGAGARDTFRWTEASSEKVTAQVIECYRDRNAMLQPFLPSIIDQGEWSLFYFGGSLSHTILKVPRPGDFRTQEEFGSQLSKVEPTPEQRRLAEQTLATVGETLLYARIDLVELPTGEPAIIELELIEPSLYFPYDRDSLKRFAQALNTMLS